MDVNVGGERLGRSEVAREGWIEKFAQLVERIGAV